MAEVTSTKILPTEAHTLPALLTVVIPGVPDSKLSPNSPAHWRTKAPLRKAARQDAYNATKYVLEGVPFVDCVQRFRLDVLVKWPGRRKYMDPQNLISALKAHFDGVADGIGVNDSRFDVGRVVQMRDEPGGHGVTTIEIREVEL